MHRHRIRAFVSGLGDYDVPVAIFGAGQFLRYVSPAVGIITASLGPGTTTINALATWGDTTGTSLLNTTTLLDNAGNMTDLVTLDGQDAPRITATLASASPVTGKLTKWASSSAPWKLDASLIEVVNVDGVDTLYLVGGINGRDPSKWVQGPATATDNAIARYDSTTGKLIQNSTVIIDDSGNVTGVTTIDGTTPGTWVQGPASSTDNTLATYNGTTGKIIKSATSITASGTQLREMTLFNSIGVSEHGFGGVLPTDKLTSINSMTLDTTTISNVTALDGVDPLTWVVGPASATANRVATFNGTTGKLIQQTSVSISSGAITGVTSINTVDPATWVVGPASSTNNRIATYNGTTGKLIQEASVTATGGALASVATINTIDPATWVVGPASATSGGLAVFSGTSGKLIASGVTITASGGGLSNVTAMNSITVGSTTLAGVTTINSVDPSTWVVGPSSATSAAIAVFSGTTGKIIADSGATLTYMQRGTAAILGTYTISTGGLVSGTGFAPGYGFEQESSSYKAVFVCDLPVSFPDTSVTLTFTVSSTDNNGRWQIHTPNSSAHVALGSSGTFVNGTPTAFGVAAFRIVASCTVPSGSGFGYSINVAISSSGTSATLESGGTQFWARAV
jgi:hypothetical protein